MLLAPRVSALRLQNGDVVAKIAASARLVSVRISFNALESRAALASFDATHSREAASKKNLSRLAANLWWKGSDTRKLKKAVEEELAGQEMQANRERFGPALSRN